jgi:hypothetical protein
MFKRKPKLCRPCQERNHAFCDGPDDCDCTWCAQARELAAVADDKATLLWPEDDVSQNA